MTTNDPSGPGQGSPGQGAVPGQDAERRGGWQPVPHGGEYDAEATAFVQLPPEDALDAPLAAPGHGYVPPSIDPQAPAGPAGADHSTPGGWAAQPVAGAPDGAYGQDAYGGGYVHGGGHGGYGPGGYEPQGTSHWNFSAVVQDGAQEGVQDGAQDGVQVPGTGFPPAGATAPGDPGNGSGAAPSGATGATGQWSIPVAGADLPDESGEFSTSVLAAQWSADAASATLPGVGTPWAPAEPAEEAPVPPGGPEPAPEAEAPVAPVPEQAPSPDPLAALDSPDSPDADFAPLTHSNDSAEHPAGSYVLRVNGADRPVTDAWIGESLLYVLRERLGLAGAKDGCSQGECGACNVQVDGRLVASCLVPAATAAGSEVRTVEGLAVDGEPSDVQRALAACGAVQCGFCIPGMAMTVHDLLEGNHAPSELETRQALCGNLCRCSGYRGVLDAVGEVVAERRASAEAAAAASEEARAGAAGDQHRNANGAGNPNANGHQSANPNANGNLNANPNGNAHQNPHPHPHQNPHPNPHSPDGGMA
ncbi:(2Fe-2S)-binding protein [Streptomyces sp. NPDC093085]|uniref:(2Fe-2S)-binding protein n=1 Tax=Streptomyces sp. NPDC093085 TaxID=3155068 RepID=UPI00344AD6DA